MPVLRKTAILTTVLLAAGTAAKLDAQVPIPRPSHPLDSVPNATVMQKAVAFINVKCKEGSGTRTLLGTGFFVSVIEPRVGANRGFLFLVTNKHVVCNGADILRATIRLNLKEPTESQGSREITVSGNWFFPEDESVDLAVIPVSVDRKVFDILPIPDTSLVTREIVRAKKIVEGSEVMFAGFFSQFPGRHRIQPIVREGIIALMPEEEIVTTMERLGRLYLADMHVYGGNSGSPVFVNMVGIRGSKVKITPFPYGLLGIVSGYFFEDASHRLHVNTLVEGPLAVKGIVKVNSGVSAVVPADELYKILNSAALIAYREMAVHAELQRNR